jgi:hypothetical protein
MMQAKNHVTTDKVNWKNLLNYPSEFIRIDEQLRLKQLELNGFDENTLGWTKVSGQCNLEHKRLIYSMRCYLHINGCHHFNTPIMSRTEYLELKASFREKDNYTNPSENNLAPITSVTQDEFLLIVSTSSDKGSTEKFYIRLIETILGKNISQAEKDNIIPIIMKNCVFTV